jgi:hypothetical protein
MNRQISARLMAVFAFAALALVLTPINVQVGTVAKPGDLSTSAISKVAKTIVYLSWSQAQAKKPTCTSDCKTNYKEKIKECKSTTKSRDESRACKKQAKAAMRKCRQTCSRERHPKQT